MLRALAQCIRDTAGDPDLERLALEMSACACDVEHSQLVHVAFPNLLSQLELDELRLLSYLAEYRVYGVKPLCESFSEMHDAKSILSQPERHWFYIEHLLTLGLVWKSESWRSTNGNTVPDERTIDWLLTSFGQEFVRASIPRRWP